MSITLSAKLNAVSLPRVGMYIGDVLFSPQICQAEDLWKEYCRVTQVSVFYRPRWEEQSGCEVPSRWISQYPPAPIAKPGKQWKGSVAVSLVQPFKWLPCLCRALEAHFFTYSYSSYSSYSFFLVMMMLGSINAHCSGHLHWVMLNSA